MQLGYELIREQLFFRKELIERLPWLIRLRWIAAGGGLAGCAAVYFFRQTLPPLPLVLVIFVVLMNNLLFKLIWQYVPPFKYQKDLPLTSSHVFNARDVQSFSFFAHVQISTDLLALFLAVYYSGGIYSPLVHFFIFHIILTGILLPPVSCYLYGILVFLVMGSLLLLQQWSVVPIYPIWFHNTLFSNESGLNEIIFRYFTLGTVILVTAFLVTTIKLSLRTKGRELLQLSKALDESNSKHTALYEMVKEMGLCSEPKALMDSATRQAARIMGVKACSIKLMDEQKRTLRFASTYGLSEDYTKSKDSIDIQKSPINRKIIEGSVCAIGKIEERDYFQYPEDIRKEGIASMICLPLRVDKMVLGVFCVYSDAEHFFTESNVQFFELMSDLTAHEIEKLKTQLNRNWFLQKSAHQLRSPMHTVISMLKVLKNGYLGPMNVRQEETVERCKKRMEMLDSLISDLLRLSISRANLSLDALRPVHAQRVLKSLSGLFETQAREKAVEIAFLIDDELPAIPATERLLDDLFSNLISNAIKYTQPGDRVTVSLARSEEDKIRIEVTDTGIGIPDEAFSHLFTEFFRAENAKLYTEAGSGLGLVIVKEILDQLKGTVTVKSRIGEGSTFTCHFPIR
ncbi:MAG: GAF domain-containing sensor histidine kinase [Proteobacteria bacterium]|nr:GAF domain-containing sensor histidine kinase [Pseudomonadota bacterium]